MRLFSDSIGRKVVMAITGLLMVLFVIFHLLGNMTIFGGENGINAYAAKLHELGPIVWATRLVMAISVVAHVILGVAITIENRAASPTRYAIGRSLKATFAGRTMIWSGLVLGAFIGYHLFHFTIRVTPGLVLGTDALNRFDVFSMVQASFRVAPIAGAYLLGMAALFLHLSHGIQSIFQSLGLNNARTLPRFELGGRLLSVVFLFGFGAIPVCIFIGILAK